MTEMPSASFVMHGARDALATGLAHIEQHVKGIERAVVENPGLAFDLARTLVEIVCRTILSERNVAFSEEDDLPKLFKTASSNVAFLPPSASGEAETRESLRRTLNGLSTTIQGIANCATNVALLHTGLEVRVPYWNRRRRFWRHKRQHNRRLSSPCPPTRPGATTLATGVTRTMPNSTIGLMSSMRWFRSSGSSSGPVKCFLRWSQEAFGSISPSSMLVVRTTRLTKSRLGHRRPRHDQNRVQRICR